MSLRSTWRALQLAPFGLEERVERLNTIALAQQPRVGVYATALLCLIEPANGRAWAVNAGHPALVRLDAAGAREVRAAAVPAAGRDRATPAWTAGEVELGPGSALLAYTDGLVEGRAAPGSLERLGTGPVLELAGAMHAEGADGDALLAALVELAASAGRRAARRRRRRGPAGPALGALGVEHLAHLAREGGLRERLLDERRVGPDDPVAEDRLVGVAGHEQHPQAGEQRGRAARRARGRRCRASRRR